MGISSRRWKRYVALGSGAAHVPVAAAVGQALTYGSLVRTLLSAPTAALVPEPCGCVGDAVGAAQGAGRAEQHRAVRFGAAHDRPAAAVGQVVDVWRHACHAAGAGAAVVVDAGSQALAPDR